MKFCKLILHRIGQYYKTNKLVFLLFLLGGITCAITFIFFYSNILAPVKAEGRENAIYRTYVITFESSKTPAEILDERLNAMHLHDILFLHIIEEENLDQVISVDKAPLQFEPGPGSGSRPDRIVSSFHDYAEMSPVMGRNQFTQEERQGKPAIVLPAHSHWPKGAKTISLYGKTFEIVGSEYSINMRIPFSSYQAMHLPTERVYITMDQNPTAAENRKIVASLKKLFPESDIADPSGTVRDEYMQIAMATALISAVYLLALISFLFLMKYMIDQNRHENIVYSIVGASRRNVIAILFVDIFVLTSLTILGGILFYLLFQTVLFDRINLASGIRLSGIDFLVIYLLMIGLSCLASIPFLWKYRKDSLITSKNQSE